MTQANSNRTLTTHSATRMAEMVRNREVSVVDLVRAHIERIEAVNPKLNAVIHPLFAEAMSAAKAADAQIEGGTAKGRLFGVPMTIKDQFCLTGTPTSVGLAHLLGKVSGADGPLVGRLREEGAIFLGKTNVPQLCLTYECRNVPFGPSNNPWNPERVPGGSSGGEAAIIAAYGSPLGLGGDMGGSIRIPCHDCGIHGLKPTGGRFPNDDSPLTEEVFGAFAGFEAFIPQPGPMARHVDDLKLMMDTLLERRMPSGDPYPTAAWEVGAISSSDKLRIGYYTEHPFFPPSPAIRRVVTEAVEGLRRCGLDVVPFDFPDIMRGYTLALSLLSAAGSTWVKKALKGEAPTPTVKNLRDGMSIPRLMRPLLARFLDAMGRNSSAALVRHTAPGNADLYQRLTAERSAYRAAFIRAMEEQQVDILICPTYAIPAPVHNADRNGTATAAACYSVLYNLLGNPAGAVAASRVRAEETVGRAASKDDVMESARKMDSSSEGLPVGVQVVGRHWREDQVLSVMKVLENYFRAQQDYPILND